jgi:hypothetical protein
MNFPVEVPTPPSIDLDRMKREFAVPELRVCELREGEVQDVEEV